MNFTSKFDIDQEVWAVSDSDAYRIVRCLTCDHTGKLTIRGEELICPKCDGRASRREYAGRKFYISTIGKVGKIQVEYQPVRWSSDEPALEINYMLDSTGVGSGQVWREAKLFGSREEAQAYCNQSNGLLLPDEVAA